MTEGLLAFQAEIYAFQVQYGFLAVPEGRDYFAFTWDLDADTPEARAAMTEILRKHGLPDATLMGHDGTEELWVVFGHRSGNDSVWVHDSDWHWPVAATQEEQRLLEAHREEGLKGFCP